MTFNQAHYLYQEDLQNIISRVGKESFKGKRFLIVGATGLIGTCLVDALMAMEDVSVCVIGRNRQRMEDRFGEYFGSPRFKFIEQIAEMPIGEDVPVDYIIPLASYTHPMAYSAEPVENVFININGCHNALQHAMRVGALVLYPSSVEIYGNSRTPDDVFDEDYTGNLNLTNSRSSYPESKRLCESLCQSYLAEYEVKSIIARLPRVFGPTMSMADSKASSQFIKNALAGENILLKSSGEQYFSYMYVADVVAAMLYVILHGSIGEVYNVANKDCDVTLKDFALTCAKFGNTNVCFGEPSQSERKGYSIAVKAILSADKLYNLGYEPIYSFENAVYRTLELLKNR